MTKIEAVLEAIETAWVAGLPELNRAEIEDEAARDIKLLLAKLRVAVSVVRVKPDGRCPLCTRTQKHMRGHYPDCAAQKFLED